MKLKFRISISIVKIRDKMFEIFKKKVVVSSLKFELYEKYFN